MSTSSSSSLIAANIGKLGLLLYVCRGGLFDHGAPLLVLLLPVLVLSYDTVCCCCCCCTGGEGSDLSSSAMSMLLRSVGIERRAIVVSAPKFNNVCESTHDFATVPRDSRL